VAHRNAGGRGERGRRLFWNSQATRDFLARCAAITRQAQPGKTCLPDSSLTYGAATPVRCRVADMNSTAGRYACRPSTTPPAPRLSICSTPFSRLNNSTYLQSSAAILLAPRYATFLQRHNHASVLPGLLCVPPVLSAAAIPIVYRHGRAFSIIPSLTRPT